MSQQKAVKLLRASAGSGKTFALTAQYLTLLFSGKGKYREILAVTFTNKATAEMKERILGSLKELALTGYQRSKFGQILQSVYPELSDMDIRQKASEIYSSILHDYSRFSVSTIDRFVQQLIRSFAFELNIDSGYKLEMNQKKVKEDLVEALNLYLENDKDLLNWVTNLAIDRINDGSDWDYHLTLMDLADEIFKERYSAFDDAMKELGADKSDEFRALQSKVKADSEGFRNEIVKRATEIKALFDASGIEAQQLHKQSNNPLYKLKKIAEGDISHLEKFEDFADDFDSWPHGKLKDTSAVEQLYRQISAPLKELIDYYKSGVVMFETYRAISKNSSYLRLMQGMAELLSNYRSEKRLLLLSDAQKLLKGVTGANTNNPSFIWEKTGNKYKNFLFDEFQDTSTFQWENFLPLLQNAIAESPGGKIADHLLVGDVKQSIYRWRNGDWRILHQQVKQDLNPLNVNEETLMFNRRSSRNIIRFNNFLYKSLPDLLQNQLNGIFVETAPEYLHPFWEAKSNLIQMAYEGSHQEITEGTPEAGMIEVKFFMKEEESEDDEHSPAASYTVQKLVELLELGIAMKDIGILVRKNAEAQQILDCVFEKENQEKLSKAAGKAFQIVSGEALKIVNNPAVSLLLSTLRLLAVHEPESGIYKAECARLWYQILHPAEENIDLRSDLWLSFVAKPLSALTEVLPDELCSSLNSLRYLPLNELTEKLIKMYRLGSGNTEIHIPYLLAFRDQVAVFSATGDKGIGAFLSWWDVEGSTKALPSSDSQDAVQLMTVHKSKGLEFGAVIVPFFNWKLNEYSNGGKRKLIWVGAEQAGFGRFNAFPVDYNKNLASTIFAGEFFDEMLLNYMDELNALYVATTRAKNYLCLVCPKTPIKKEKDKGGPANELHYILHQMFENGQTEDLVFVEGDNHYVFGEIPSSSIEQISESKNQYLKIPDYQVNEELTDRFKRNSRNEETWFNSRQRKGIVLHKILELLVTEDELDKLIAEKVQEGFIRESEKEEVKKDILEILRQEEIREWFATAKSVISERDMIIESGLVKRPDKLFVFEDRAVLLDFKFGAEQNKYIADISLYRDNLLKMDEFKEVDAYLWYAESRKLQKV